MKSKASLWVMGLEDLLGFIGIFTEAKAAASLPLQLILNISSSNREMPEES